METLQNLVRELVILIILAVFLELLLPHGDLRRYVRMVLGLLIIVAVLQAGVSFWNRDLAVDLSWVSLGPPDQAATAEIIREGERLWQMGQARAMNEYEEGLARQIKALAGLNPDLRVSEVRVRLEGGAEAGNLGRLEEVILVLDEDGAWGGEEVPVTGQPIAAPDPQAVDRLRGLVADFYGLSPEQVTIVGR
ncbi:MAG: stage III sporulation protein AF [Candidatus Desulforudis sp.]|nr:stage III sporulation protein AF [Desulforudis sp.]